MIGRRSALAITLVLLALAILLPSAADAATGPIPKPRPGTAAYPFGSATAIGNLDSDGKPDFAVADRAASGPQGYDYRLELGLSREQSQIFHFHSPHSALTVSILDLDNDRDLDVVLSQAVSGEVAEVWINNGSGEFRRGNAAGFGGLVIHAENRMSVDPGGSVAVIAGPPVRKFASLAAGPVCFRGPPVFVTGFHWAFENSPSRNVPSRASAPRAPPLQSILS